MRGVRHKMNLNEVNHVITEVKKMLNALETELIISGANNQDLLPVLVQIILKNEAVGAEYTP